MKLLAVAIQYSQLQWHYERELDNALSLQMHDH